MSIIILSRNPLKHTHKMSLLRHELHSVFSSSQIHHTEYKHYTEKCLGETFYTL